ncbi:hypothetical protein AB0H57_18155 [Micromonospora sp. NPDC050686]|uniref:hypothetical protein n=1 Tax=Micromonospora sp. NPDC050686 TaxID=3154631 RepID=UPI0033F0CC39
MWYPPTDRAEQHLWTAVASGVRMAGVPDNAGFEAAVSRLGRLRRPWVYRVLGDTAALLAEELNLDVAERVPMRIRVEPDPPARFPRRALPPSAVGSDDPTPEIRRRLLLIAHLADAAQVGVGACLDVALAGNRRSSRPLSGSIPTCRTGGGPMPPHTSILG